MAITTKIKKYAIGLYTICGGYISRPFFGTQFEEGDTEKFNEGFDKPIPPQSQIIKEGQDPVPAPPKPNNIS